MKHRILIIDDEPEMTAIVRLILESEIYCKVLEVTDPTTAQETARDFAPDLVFMDVMMPFIDGSELAARFLEDPQLQNVAVVFLTALVDRQETFAHASYFVRGGRTFLPKPIAARQLIDCVKKKLAHKPALPRHMCA